MLNSLMMILGAVWVLIFNHAVASNNELAVSGIWILAFTVFIICIIADVNRRPKR